MSKAINGDTPQRPNTHVEDRIFIYDSEEGSYYTEAVNGQTKHSVERVLNNAAKLRGISDRVYFYVLKDGMDKVYLTSDSLDSVKAAELWQKAMGKTVLYPNMEAFENKLPSANDVIYKHRKTPVKNRLFSYDDKIGAYYTEITDDQTVDSVKKALNSAAKLRAIPKVKFISDDNHDDRVYLVSGSKIAHSNLDAARRWQERMGVIILFPQPDEIKNKLPSLVSEVIIGKKRENNIQLTAPTELQMPSYKPTYTLHPYYNYYSMYHYGPYNYGFYPQPGITINNFYPAAPITISNVQGQNNVTIQGASQMLTNVTKPTEEKKDAPLPEEKGMYKPKSNLSFLEIEENCSVSPAFPSFSDLFAEEKTQLTRKPSWTESNSPKKNWQKLLLDDVFSKQPDELWAEEWEETDKHATKKQKKSMGNGMGC